MQGHYPEYESTVDLAGRKCQKLLELHLLWCRRLCIHTEMLVPRVHMCKCKRDAHADMHNSWGLQSHLRRSREEKEGLDGSGWACFFLSDGMTSTKLFNPLDMPFPVAGILVQNGAVCPAPL